MGVRPGSLPWSRKARRRRSRPALRGPPSANRTPGTLHVEIPGTCGPRAGRRAGSPEYIHSAICGAPCSNSRLVRTDRVAPSHGPPPLRNMRGDIILLGPPGISISEYSDRREVFPTGSSKTATRRCRQRLGLPVTRYPEKAYAR